jgi:Arc/MetJ-type ribon-helix-helix transcriptional regulator
MISPMNVALSDTAESFVLQKVHAGKFETAESVVERALDAWQAREMLQDADAGTLGEFLLQGVRSPVRDYRPGQFSEMVRRQIAGRQGT